MSRLWDRGVPADEALVRLAAGRDPELDLELVPHDCRASAAHAVMLEEIGVLAAEERTALCRELAAIAREAEAGEFAIRPEDEDGHTAIENRLTKSLGDAGRKIHTGRSRNDQVIATLRLWGREAVLAQAAATLEVIERLLELSGRDREVTFPGTTHTRQAMPTTLGHTWAAWAENLLDDLPWLAAAHAHLDRSPLGSAAGFGVALALDRARVAELLGFASVQANTLAVQNDRGKGEALALAAAAAVATDLGRLAADLIRWSSEELGFVRLPDAVTTGSSIMPQKRNPDLLELVRAGAARLRSRQAETASILGGLGAGYHRDLQLTKEPFLAGMRELVDLLTATGAALAALEVDAARCLAALAPATGATDAVYRRVARGEPFRTAYRDVASDPEAAVGDGFAAGWRGRTHLGAPGALDPEPARAAVERWRGWCSERRAISDAAPFPGLDAA